MLGVHLAKYTTEHQVISRFLLLKNFTKTKERNIMCSTEKKAIFFQADCQPVPDRHDRLYLHDGYVSYTV